MAASGCSDQPKIFREMSASKFQGQHATQFRYDGLCSATKTEIHHGCILRDFRTGTLGNNFGGCFWKGNSGREGCTMTIVVLGFYFF